MILVGTSGFSYKDWRGFFYPEGFPEREMLSFYAQHFKAVEINSTYYAIPGLRSVDSMIRKSQGRLEFVLKAHQNLTHTRERARETLPAFRAILGPFREASRLGCVLAQFPYSFKPTPDNRDHLLWLREGLPETPLVVEIRNQAWIDEEIRQVFRENQIGYCCVDEPRLPGLPRGVVWATGPIGYVRFHGRNRQKWWHHQEPAERYDYLYSEGELREWLPKLQELTGAMEKVFVFFNNHPHGQAAINARMLREMLSAEQGPEAVS